jgi:hypothetical protein
MADNSVITRRRRELLCGITSGAISSMPPVAKIAFGVGGLDARGEPTPPLEDATALASEIARYDAVGPEFPKTTTARYTATIPAGELVGASISEAALVDADGGLCAIKTMYPKRKDDGVVFTFTFDDEF